MLLQQQGRLLLRIEKLEARSSSGAAPARRVAGLPVGSPAPDFHVESVSGRLASLSELIGASRSVALVFTDPDCPACTSLASDISQWRRRFRARLRIVVVSVRDTTPGRGLLSEYGHEDVYLQRNREVADSYMVTGTPSAVVIQGNQTIGSQLAEGADAIRDLMASLDVAVEDATPRIPQPALLQ
jgi:peroxiredoxin